MSITVDDLSSFPATLQNGWYTGMQLSNLSGDIGTELKLAASCTEEIAGALLLVSGADETIAEEGGTVDGEAYVYVGADTPTTGETYLSNDAPTFVASKRGYYSGVSGAGSYKAIFQVTKTGTDYSNSRRLGAFQPYELDVSSGLRSENGTYKAVSVRGTVITSELPEIIDEGPFNNIDTTAPENYTAIGSLTIPYAGIWRLKYYCEKLQVDDNSAPHTLAIGVTMTLSTTTNSVTDARFSAAVGSYLSLTTGSSAGIKKSWAPVYKEAVVETTGSTQYNAIYKTDDGENSKQVVNLYIIAERI